MSIRILPSSLVSMIAAGEVVERPASALKELIENAIDAEARRIDVRVPRSDLSGFTVTDDGLGMNPEDLALALERHATSKLPDGRLSSVDTLGFRGEALPSIGACASVLVRSRPAGQDVAFSVSQSHGGPLSSARPCAGGFGTSVTVEGLFDNLPARKKFLKSARTEKAWIRHVFDRAALANPHLAMSLDMSGAEPVRYRPNTLTGRIGDVLGEPLRSGGLKIEYDDGTVRVDGLTCMPSGIVAGSSAGVEIYVNGRHVSDRYVSAAVQQAYRELTGTDMQPQAVVMLTVPPETVDVNVHPRKAEIRFSDHGAVCAAVRNAVAEALGRTGLRPASALAGVAKVLASSSGAAVDDDRRRPLGRYVGQVGGSWLVAETLSGLVIVDQHAAHERIILERLKKASADIAETVVKLPSPVKVTLDDFDAAAVAENADTFSTLGFSISVHGREVSLHAFPAALSRCQPTDLLHLAVRCAARGVGEGLAAEAVWETLATAACKAAIKAGDALDAERGSRLLREIEETPAAAVCNHGRPTTIHLTNSDLSRLFGRT